VYRAKNSYGITALKPNNITAHLSETLTYLHRFPYVHSESEALSASNTVGYTGTNVIGSRTSFVIASDGSTIHRNICIYGKPVPGPQPREKLPINTKI